jgi:CRP-like cAMP-binding protein
VTTTAASAAAEAVRTLRRDRSRQRRMGPLWVGVLEDLPLFSGLSRRHLRRIANLAEAARFEPGTTIVREGAREQTFFVILDGTASIERDGNRRRIGSGDFFGEMALIDGAPRSATVRAESELLAMRLARAPFMRTLKDEPAIALKLLQELAARVRRLEGADRGGAP